MKILSYNFYCRPRIIFNDKQIKRTQIIEKMKHLDKFDVVMFQELFDNKVYKKMKKIMKEKGFIYRTKRAGVKYSPLMNGGSIIFSKHKIIKTDMLIYKPGSIFVSSCQKGVNYAQILDEKTNKVVNVFNFHLDTFSEEERKNQLTKLKNWMYGDLKLTKKDIIIIGGDWNINYYTNEVNNMKDIFDNMKLCDMNFLNNKIKWTCWNKNDWAIRRDLDKNEKNELIDMFMIQNVVYKSVNLEMFKSYKPIKSKAISFSTPFYFNIYDLFKKFKNITDLSDHYGISIELML